MPLRCSPASLAQSRSPARLPMPRRRSRYRSSTSAGIFHRCSRSSRTTARRTRTRSRRSASNARRSRSCRRRSRPSRTQDAGRLDINLIMTGQAAASALIANNQLVRLLPDYEKLFPLDDFTEAAKAHLKEGEGYVIPSVVSNGGPVFIYNPKKVPNPPKTADELLAFANANPGKFFLRAAVEQRPRHVGHRRPALHPWRQGSEGS